MLRETMFADSLLETSWAQRTRRSWTTLTSFGLEMIAIGLLLLLPLWKTVGLPAARTVSIPISAGRADPGPSPQTHSTIRSGVRIIPVTGRLMAPGKVPTGISKNDDSSSQAPDGAIGDPTGFRVGPADGPPISIFSGTRPVLPTAPVPPVRTFRTSNMLEGSLIQRVQPQYPFSAKVAHVEGQVLLSAIISKEGTIENLHVLSGHPLLVGAAIESVRRWRYKPYILNGEPVEVETQITVNFVLSHN